MNLNQETVQIGDVAYVANELPIRVMLPLVEKMDKDAFATQLEMLGAAVTVNGVPLGEAAGDLGMAKFMALVKAVLRVNGMGDAAPKGN